MRIDPEFAELYRREFTTVFRSVLALTGDRELAADATQEAFARALARWRRLRDQSWAGGWVMTTALNVARRALRRRRDVDTPDDEPRDVDVSLDVWRGVARLPARQQQAVVLHYVQGYSVAETAQAMGCGDGTVKAHLSRARAALRAELEGVREDA